MKNFKGRTIIGLILVYVAVFMNWQWMWGILFLIWVLPDLLTGVTYFMEPISKKENPMLYWFIVGTWLWMSAYLVATPFFPQLNMQNFGSTTYKATATGKYEEDQTSNKMIHLPPVNALKGKPVATNSNSQQQKLPKQETIPTAEGKKAKAPQTTPSAVKVAKPKATNLEYKTYTQPTTQHFIGISATMNSFDPDLEKHTTELWEYFYKHDITQSIPNILDSKVYVVYHDYDTPNQGDYKMTIGFQVKDLTNIYEGLTGVTVPPTKFAVFEQGKESVESFIATTWEKIVNSDLNIVNSYSLETYELDNTYNIKKADIRVAIK